ncbi:aspartyl-tRNA synthetase [Spiroplasma clarkii]|uniref:Aspartate--tRNA ligase n=1 Tax=Spiroplasma clarkii TaxID=2139 RepID=A0A1Y0L1J0_9MOLU|nr:aspartate--tRNA ligase [Spiroplasma clarkii]ARU91640.1 aspartyl-tRNA synthetase [Spiroplasma clarkii]ATX71034.1 aspartyl-tRNA synthetase [Spiroplasma clarkii]
MKRTHTCGELNLKNVGTKVILQGWIAKIRKMGALTFIDLRDRYGITQLVIGEKLSSSLASLKPEYVIEVSGLVIERKSKNPDLATGAIEIEVNEIVIINKSELTPFEIKNQIESQEDTRLTYRYLDLRRPEMQNNLLVRSQMNHSIRNYFIENNFIEIETPVFGKSTPEGARDFLVPSRLNQGKFYALPQSPQLYKQLFMISGFDRYFQIVKCFRNEDLRIDRQPEFTQLDMEMSFANSEDVMQTIESLVKKVFLDIKKIKINEPITRLSWADAFDKYGNDKPDLRFGYEIKTLNDLFLKTTIPLFENINNKVIRAICVTGLLNKKDLEALTETAKQNSVEILPFVKFNNNEWSGSLASKLSDSEKQSLIEKYNLKEEATILFAVDDYIKASKALGAVRNHIAKLQDLLDPNIFKFAWITNFPLFEFSEEENRYVAAHHPFTMPSDECLDNFDTDKENATAKAYDLVLNGFEIGGGSQRITDPNIQQRMFDAIELTKEQVEQNFGWFVNAYRYGAPYHSGCALGLDRICMLLTGSENIREVIAFPKNSSGIDPMTNAPDAVTLSQLEELNLQIKK